jgi:TRAP-type C4-dicarboxylate transport system permease small subunit
MNDSVDHSVSTTHTGGPMGSRAFFKKIRAIFLPLHKGINFVEYSVAVLAIVALVIVLALQVYSRYIAQSPISWTVEIAAMLMTWLSFMGAAIGVYHKSHMSVEVVNKRFSPRWLKINQVGIHALVFFFAVIVAYYGTIFVKESNYVTSVLRISHAWQFLSIALSAAFMAIHSLYHIVDELSGESGSGDVLEDEVA